MTRNLFIVAGLLLMATIALFIAGIASAQAALPVLSLVCLAPMFCFFLGGAVFRFSSEYQIAPKAQTAGSRQRIIRPGTQAQPEILS